MAIERNNSPISVNTGELEIGHENDVFSAIGIGSCVVVCLYDEESHVGGVAHIMLPEEKQLHSLNPLLKSSKEKPAKYADTGIERLIRDIKRSAKNEQITLKAKIAGGAEMFTVIASGKDRIGPQNIRAVEQELNERGVMIIDKDLGGHSGRSVNFNLKDFKMDVVKKFKK